MQTKQAALLPNILITGTPGTGKTTFAALLTFQLNNALSNMGVADSVRFTHIELSKTILNNKLFDEWDFEMNCSVFNEDMVLDFLEPIMAHGGIIIDFHGADFFPERFFNFVFILRTENKILYSRLKERGYTEAKIQGNIECEIFEECKQEALESYKNDIVFELQNNLEEEMNKNIKFCFDVFVARNTFKHLMPTN